MKRACVGLVAALALACTGQFGDPSGEGLVPDASLPMSSEDGSSSPIADGSRPTEMLEASGSGGLADSSSDAPTGPAAIEDGGVSCATTMDSYGYTRCACQQGVVGTSNAVASCTGYDCCVLFGPDSGLAEGFGNPSLSADLCACYSSADIAAILGSPVSCSDFANGEGMVVSSCP